MILTPPSCTCRDLRRVAEVSIPGRGPCLGTQQEGALTPESQLDLVHEIETSDSGIGIGIGGVGSHRGLEKKSEHWESGLPSPPCDEISFRRWIREHVAS